MKMHFPQRLGGLGLVSSRIGTEAESKRSPKVIIGAVGEPLAAALAAQFTKLGWRVKHATDGEDARRHAAICRAAAVILPAEALAESGFLACAKLAFGLAKTRVVLVGEESEENEQFARFAGAAGYVTPDTPAHEVVRLVAGRLAATLV
jgi:DNA-binding response OmpR family regulator